MKPKFLYISILTAEAFSSPLTHDQQPSGNSKEISGPVFSTETKKKIIDYYYNKTNIDPFKPWIEKKETIESEIIDPLQRSDLKEMTLVGTILGMDPVAMVTLSLNNTKNPIESVASTSSTENYKETFLVRIGEPIGNRRGKLIAIAQDHIVVRELAQLKDGIQRHKFQLSLLKMSTNRKKTNGFMLPGGGIIPETSQSLSIKGTIGLPGESKPPAQFTQGIPPSIKILPGGSLSGHTEHPDNGPTTSPR